MGFKNLFFAIGEVQLYNNSGYLGVEGREEERGAGKLRVLVKRDYSLMCNILIFTRRK